MLPLETAVAIAIAFAAFAVCWWVGFRWRSFLLLGLGVFVGGALGRGFAFVLVEPGFFHALENLDYIVKGAALGGIVCFLHLLAFHLASSRHQSMRISRLVTRPEIQAFELGEDQLESAMAAVESHSHVKYVPYGVAESAFEDWVDAVAERRERYAIGEVYLLLPYRTRVRFPGGVYGRPRLSNGEDCIVLRRSSSGRVHATPVSKSRFCERAMESIHVAAAEST